MKRNNVSRITALLTAAGIWVVVGTGVNAAVTVDLATQGIGYIRPTVLGSAFTLTELDNMIKVYNGTAVSPIGGETYTVVQGSGTPNPALAVPGAMGSDPAGGNTANGLPSYTMSLGSGGYTYLVTQWDGPNGANAVYYIGGLSGSITIVNDLGTYTGDSQDSAYGLSHTYLIPGTAVPEPTTMVAGAGALGLALLGIGRARRSGVVRIGK